MICRLICIFGVRVQQNQVSHNMKVSKGIVLKLDGRICHKKPPYFFKNCKRLSWCFFHNLIHQSISLD